MKYYLASFAFLVLSLSMPDVTNANVVGTDAQNFNTITSGLDFVTVQSSETLKPGIANFGLFFNYAVNTLPYFEKSAQSRDTFNDSLLGADVNMGLGLLKDWDAGVSFPFIVTQTVDNQSTAGGQFSKTGNTEIRVNTKYHVLGDDSQGIAVVGSVNVNRIGNNPYEGLNPGPTYNLEIAADTTVSKSVALGVNFGHRWRNPGTPIAGVPIEPFKNQYIYSGAASYLLPETSTKLIAEIFGASPSDTSNQATARSQTSLEGTLGVKHDINTNVAVHFGAGAGIGNAIASPSWRVYTGVNWAVGPLWTHSDSVELERVNAPEVVEAKEPAPEVPPADEKFIAAHIFFEFASDQIKGDIKPTIDALYAYLNKPPLFRKLTVEGHTDSVGNSEYNRKLSQRRADAIRNYIIKNYKVDPRKIEAIGYGSTKPIADNGNFQGRQRNRRVEFTIER